MNELLFKLKKDGQCVGYMKYALYSEGGCILLWHRLPQDEGWRLPELKECRVFDSIHPFVCRDRHGKDVYADDTVKQDGRLWYVKWDANDMGWCLRDLAGELPPQIPDPLTIELIDAEPGKER